MMNAIRHVQSRRKIHPALTLAEAVVSIAIVGVMLVAAMETVGASQATQRKVGDRARATLLAEELMSEILRQEYEDPDLTTGSFGLESAETGTGSRALWDDVDDYNGWSAAPPQEKDGTVLTGFTGWRRTVAVNWVSVTDAATTQSYNTGVKRITITVAYDDLPVIELTALRTSALSYAPEE